MSVVARNQNSVIESGQMGASLGSSPSLNGSAAAPQIDILGPILRRKALIVLLSLLGCALAYFAYTKASPVYESAVRLMITTQAPPTVDGQLNRQKFSIAKHERLISSQLILAAAAEQGEFETMKTFEESSNVLLTLTEVLDFGYSKKEDDGLLQVTAKGPDQDELPNILKQVVNAYMAEIAKDSKIDGETSLKLVASLRDQLVDEKNIAEESYLKILRRLNLPTVEQKGTLFNPFLDELDVVKTDHAETRRELRDVSSRVELAKKAIESSDQGQVNYLATEAKKFLGVEIETAETADRRTERNGIDQHLVNQYTSRIFALEALQDELQSRKFTSAKGMGAGHPEMASIKMQIRNVGNRLKNLREDFNEIRRKNGADEESEEEFIASIARRNRQWIAIYLATLEAEKERLENSVDQLHEDVIVVEGKAKNVAADILELGILKSRIAEKQKGIEEVLEQFSQINVVHKNFNRTKVRIIDSPGVGVQVAPSLPKYVAIGLLLGGMLGAGLAFMIDLTDNTFRNPNEIATKLACPVIGKLPPIKIARKRRQEIKNFNPALVSLYDPTSEASEAFRTIRASIFSATYGEECSVLMMTSPSPGDGKSTTCSNLAVAIAQAGKTVVLVDADLRRPKVHKYSGLPIAPGLTQCLSGERELTDCLRESDQLGLSFLTAGGTPANPGEVVTSSGFRQLIELLREKYDYVLIDSPPMLPVADPSVISSMVDGVYMVMRIRKGVAVTSEIAKEKLAMVGANLMGVIVNGIDDNPYYDDFGSYGYGYGYGYGNGYNNKAYKDYLGVDGEAGPRIELAGSQNRIS